MRFSDLLAKLANQARLTPQELDQLKRYGNDTEQRNSFVSGNTTAQGTLDIKFPFMPFYSEVLTVDTASIHVPVPSGYKNMLILCNGRSTAAGTGSQYLRANFNGDTGNNYAWQYWFIQNTTVTAGNDNSQAYAMIGNLGGSGLTAGETTSSFAFLFNYSSNVYIKTVQMIHGMSATSTFVGNNSSSWKVTTPITAIDLSSGGSASIAAGTIISIYGIL